MKQNLQQRAQRLRTRVLPPVPVGAISRSFLVLTDGIHIRNQFSHGLTSAERAKVMNIIVTYGRKK